MTVASALQIKPKVTKDDHLVPPKGILVHRKYYSGYKLLRSEKLCLKYCSECDNQFEGIALTDAEAYIYIFMMLFFSQIAGIVLWLNGLPK